MAENENENPNLKLTPYYDGEIMRWVTVVEYYALMGGAAIKSILLESENGEESHTV